MKLFLSPHILFKPVLVAGLKCFAAPIVIKDVEYPERNKLRMVRKVPQYPANMRPFKMQKKLRLMRGPELYHNTLLHQQYGIVARGGGRLKFCHFEMIRYSILRNLDFNVAFAIWRVTDPWQPITKKSLGTRMGSGKANIDHYVTPVKKDQIIIEVGGKIQYFEVKRVLKDIANKLPFAAIPVSQEILDKNAKLKQKMKEENLNPWTWKYIIQNNMLGSHDWISKYDRRWYNEYL